MRVMSHGNIPIVRIAPSSRIATIGCIVTQWDGGMNRECSDEAYGQGVLGKGNRWFAVWRHRCDLLRIARRLVTSTHDAEDVVHEALLRAIESQNIDDHRLGAWLTSVTLRLCADVHRRRAREERHWARLGIPSHAGLVEDDVCDRAEAHWALEQTKLLPARQAKALHLRAEGLSIADLAQQMGENSRVAESLLARARAALKAALASTPGVGR